MMNTKFKTLIFTLFFLTSCDSHQYWQDSPYVVVAIDSTENIFLAYSDGNGGGIERIAPKIVSVGSNKKYVVAKQCRGGGCNYYYIIRSMDSKFADSNFAVKGPFSEEKFILLSNTLNLPKLKRI